MSNPPLFFALSGIDVPHGIGNDDMPGDGKTDPGFTRNVKVAKFLLIAFSSLSAVFFILFSVIFSLIDFVVVLGLSMLFIGPAYIANAMMVFTSDGRPIDGGRNFVDGKRLFGQHKTRGGFIGGVFFGALAAFFFNLIFYWNFPAIESYALTQMQFLSYFDMDYLRAFLYPEFYVIPIRAFFCGLGAPLGDLIKSFFKRRVSIGSGQPFWIMDQLDFVITTSLLSVCWFPLRWSMFIFLVLFSPSITLIANTVAFTTGKKDVPW